MTRVSRSTNKQTQTKITYLLQAPMLLAGFSPDMVAMVWWCGVVWWRGVVSYVPVFVGLWIAAGWMAMLN